MPPVVGQRRRNSRHSAAGNAPGKSPAPGAGDSQSWPVAGFFSPSPSLPSALSPPLRGEVAAPLERGHPPWPIEMKGCILDAAGVNSSWAGARHCKASWSTAFVQRAENFEILAHCSRAKARPGKEPKLPAHCQMATHLGSSRPRGQKFKEPAPGRLHPSTAPHHYPPLVTLMGCILGALGLAVAGPRPATRNLPGALPPGNVLKASGSMPTGQAEAWHSKEPKLSAQCQRTMHLRNS